MSPVRTAPATLTAGDADRRAAYLNEVVELLHPSLPRNGSGEPLAEYLVVPDVRRPRLLAPAGSRSLSVAAIRRYAVPQSPSAKLKRSLAVGALRTGLSAALLRDRIRVYGPPNADTIQSYLRRVLGRPVAVGIHIGPARANRKPVLVLLSPAGDPIGFAKLGVNALTRRLVRAEGAALQTLAAAAPRHFTVPRLIHIGQWQGHEVLLMSALPTWPARPARSPARLVAAMREVAALSGSRGPLAEGAYWVGLRSRLADITAHEEGRSLAAAAHQLVTVAGAVSLDYGCWHGDWAPWNMLCQPSSLLVWDWERFDAGVPVGFDAIHHALQSSLGLSGGSAAAAVDDVVARAPALLAPFDVAPDAAGVTALLYLVDLAARYITDRQAEAGGRLGVLGTWLLPVLLRRVSSLRGTS